MAPIILQPGCTRQVRSAPDLAHEPAVAARRARRPAPGIPWRHVPQHPTAEQLRAARDDRRGAGRSSAVRPQGERDDEAVRGEPGGVRRAPSRRSPRSRPGSSTPSSRRPRRRTARSRRPRPGRGPRSATGGPAERALHARPAGAGRLPVRRVDRVPGRKGAARPVGVTWVMWRDTPGYFSAPHVVDDVHAGQRPGVTVRGVRRPQGSPPSVHTRGRAFCTRLSPRCAQPFGRCRRAGLGVPARRGPTVARRRVVGGLWCRSPRAGRPRRTSGRSSPARAGREGLSGCPSRS